MTAPTGRSNKLLTAARLVLGLLFAFSGANHLFWFWQPPPLEGPAAQFMSGLQQTAYFFPLLGAVEVAGALLLLSGRLVPLALAALAPVAVNVVAFHVALAPAGLPVAAVILSASLTLAWHHRAAYTLLLQGHATAASRTRLLEGALGLAFVASGLAGLAGATPPPSTAGAAVMLEGLAASGYFMPLLSLVQVAAGGLLLVRRFVGLALLGLAPLVVEILAYRLWVATPGMLAIVIGLLAALAAVTWSHRQLFAPLLSTTSTSGGRQGALEVAP